MLVFAVPDHLLSSLQIACPEVAHAQLDPDCEELKEQVNLTAQDVWSLACILIWLLTGENPFLMSEEEQSGLTDRNDTLTYFIAKQQAVVSKINH